MDEGPAGYSAKCCSEVFLSRQKPSDGKRRHNRRLLPSEGFLAVCGLIVVDAGNIVLRQEKSSPRECRLCRESYSVRYRKFFLPAKIFCRKGFFIDASCAKLIQERNGGNGNDRSGLFEPLPGSQCRLPRAPDRHAKPALPLLGRIGRQGG